MAKWENHGFLGIAHSYMGYNLENDPNIYARFGYNYVSAMFLISNRRPFSILKLGKMFCIASTSNSGKCDNVQFISSILKSRNQLIIAYGTNDCDGRLISLPINYVGKLLEPVQTDDLNHRHVLFAEPSLKSWEECRLNISRSRIGRNVTSSYIY